MFYTQYVEQEVQWLEQIRANPDDRGLRLIIADWYEEQGQSERAEFIRAMIAYRYHLQCQHKFGMAGMVPMEQDEENAILSATEVDAKKAVIEKWFDERRWGKEIEEILGWNFTQEEKVSSGDHWQHTSTGNYYQFSATEYPNFLWQDGYIHCVKAEFDKLHLILEKVCKYHPVQVVQPISFPRLQDGIAQLETNEGRRFEHWQICPDKRAWRTYAAVEEAQFAWLTMLERVYKVKVLHPIADQLRKEFAPTQLKLPLIKRFA